MIENKTKKSIIKKASKLFAYHRYSGTTMQLIANEVGIQKASLYYFFDTKEEIYVTVIELIIDEIINLFNTKAKLGVVLEKLFIFTAKNGPILSFPPTLSEQSCSRLEYKKHEVTAVMKIYLDYLRVTVPTKEAVQLIIDTSHMHAYRSAQEKQSFSSAQYAKLVTKLLTK